MAFDLNRLLKAGPEATLQALARQRVFLRGMTEADAAEYAGGRSVARVAFSGAGASHGGGRALDASGSVSMGPGGFPAAGPMQTLPNDGPLAPATLYIDPEGVPVLLSALTADKIAGKRVFGSWTDTAQAWRNEEALGQIKAYGDFSEDGYADANVDFDQRQNYVMQLMMKLGDREQDVWSRARVSMQELKRRAAKQIMDQAQNAMFFFGVSGLANYGFLNDPNLPAAIPPMAWVDKDTPLSGAPTAGQTPITLWSQKNGLQIYTDILALINQSCRQARNGMGISMQSNDAHWVIVSGTDAATAPVAANQYGLTAREMLNQNLGRDNFTWIEAPEMDLGEAGGRVVVFPREVDGIRTMFNGVQLAYQESRIRLEVTSWRQKAFGSTSGCIIRRPFLVASMVGV